jgi:hypothetical protein
MAAEGQTEPGLGWLFYIGGLGGVAIVISLLVWLHSILEKKKKMKADREWQKKTEEWRKEEREFQLRVDKANESFVLALPKDKRKKLEDTLGRKIGSFNEIESAIRAAFKKEFPGLNFSYRKAGSNIWFTFWSERKEGVPVGSFVAEGEEAADYLNTAFNNLFNYGEPQTLDHPKITIINPPGDFVHEFFEGNRSDNTRVIARIEPHWQNVDNEFILIIDSPELGRIEVGNWNIKKLEAAKRVLMKFKHRKFPYDFEFDYKDSNLKFTINFKTIAGGDWEETRDFLDIYRHLNGKITLYGYYSNLDNPEFKIGSIENNFTNKTWSDYWFEVSDMVSDIKRIKNVEIPFKDKVENHDYHELKHLWEFLEKGETIEHPKEITINYLKEGANIEGLKELDSDANFRFGSGNMPYIKEILGRSIDAGFCTFETVNTVVFSPTGKEIVRAFEKGEDVVEVILRAAKDEFIDLRITKQDKLIPSAIDYKREIERLSNVIEENPNDVVALNDRTVDLLILSHYVDEDDEKQECLEKAKADALKAEEIEKGKGLYNTACAEAMLLEKEDAFKHLEESLERDLIPLKHVKEDEDWGHLRDDPKFKLIIEKYKSKSSGEVSPE